jgi:bifunctional non-homologous end joining protein LigD
MPSDSQAREVPRDPHEWRPQEPRRSRRRPEIVDPILEPFWQGIRVLAHFNAEPQGGEGPSLELIDQDGDEMSEVAPEAAAALARSIMALEAVVDGILTPQATADPTGTSLVASAHVPSTSFILPHKPEVTHAPPRGHRARGDQLAFVALDLLSVDGQPLLDLPLLERKRLLESLFVQGQLVRVSVYTRPPLKPWLSSWQSAGFRGLMMKAANSRYRPGGETSEWVLVERESQG